MEKHQRDHITEHLPELIENTTVTPFFLSIFQSKGVLRKTDVESLLETIVSSSSRSHKLYEILQDRKNAYDVLKLGLLTTKQSGAYDILNQDNGQVSDDGAASIQLGALSYNKSARLRYDGSNSEVYQGRFGKSDVAVKVTNCKLIDPQEAVNEVHLLTKLDSHENIIQFYTAVVKKEMLYTAFELCAVNLQEWVQAKCGGVEKEEILKQATCGVDYLHSKNIVHSDLAPNNILMTTSTSGSVRIKLSDFRTSFKIVEDETSFVALAEESNDWDDPEISEHTPSGTSSKVKMSLDSDIFPLGCLYYYVLSDGSHPFGNSSDREENILDGNFNLQFENPDEEIRYRSKIENMISKNPETRPGCATIISDLFPGTVALSQVDKKVGAVTQTTQTVKVYEVSARLQELHDMMVQHVSDGKLVLAVSLCKQEIKDLEKAVGRDHPDVAYMLNSLAWVYIHQDKHVEASEVVDDAIAICKKTVGTNNIIGAEILNTQAVLSWREKRFEDAQMFGKQALISGEIVFGKDHTMVGIYLCNLGLTCMDQSKYKDAEEYYTRAIGILESQVDIDHESVARSKNNLGMCYRRQGYYSKAEILYKQVLTWAYEKEHGAIEGDKKPLWLLSSNCADYDSWHQLAKIKSSIKDIALKDLRLLYSAQMRNDAAAAIQQALKDVGPVK